MMEEILLKPFNVFPKFQKLPFNFAYAALAKLLRVSGSKYPLNSVGEIGDIASAPGVLDEG